MKIFICSVRTINKIVIPQFPGVPNPNITLSSIPLEPPYFIIVECAFSVCLWIRQSRALCLYLGGQQYTWPFMFQGFTEGPSYFSEVLDQDLKDLTSL